VDAGIHGGGTAAIGLPHAVQAVGGAEAGGQLAGAVFRPIDGNDDLIVRGRQGLLGQRVQSARY
jgi:hypothetical protein